MTAGLRPPALAPPTQAAPPEETPKRRPSPHQQPRRKRPSWEDPREIENNIRPDPSHSIAGGSERDGSYPVSPPAGPLRGASAHLLTKRASSLSGSLQPLPLSARRWRSTTLSINTSPQHSQSDSALSCAIARQEKQQSQSPPRGPSPGKGSVLLAIEPPPTGDEADQPPSPPVSVPGSLAQLPRPSGWLGRTIRLGYAIQFARRPPKFGASSLPQSEVGMRPCFGPRLPPFWRRERSSPSYQSRCSTGFTARTSLSQERRGAAPHPRSACPEQAPTQAAVQEDHAEAHPDVCQMSGLVRGNRPEGRVLSCLDPPSTSAVPTVRFRGAGMSVQGPPLRSVPVSTCLHEDRGSRPPSPQGKRCADTELSQRLAHLGTLARSVVYTQGPGARLGLQVNWEKSKLSPVQSILFLGMELDSVSMTARLTTERAQSVLNCLKVLRQSAVPLKQFQRLLVYMASSVGVVPLGLMHMRPLQHWLQSRVPWRAWHTGSRRMVITPVCRCTLTPWSSMTFLRTGVPLGQVSRHVVVTTDASLQGWGATGMQCRGGGRAPACVGGTSGEEPGMQISFANFHWPFLNTQKMIGSQDKAHSVGSTQRLVPSIREPRLHP
ncbi:proline-rich protein 36-like [Triplophysa rosa]|uniref:proline-rich protein 36-like n=1 Tax=Triplophysa rosa TaxID=992332 RepID=UPI002545F6FD|nr:proline-rich protein 36-like [Triplophysa rosa]